MKMCYRVKYSVRKTHYAGICGNKFDDLFIFKYCGYLKFLGANLVLLYEFSHFYRNLKNF